ncbi:hypothetical protein GCM10009087_47630 [Sphingomonas oligophenolica]|uniref:Uncharacterized protein n=1 Tax=Sphingomonas oligophenolica TaxID=301154 RepID=A0ABU9Y769_9SPHN
MTLQLVSPDRFVRHVPLGFAFRDASDLSLIGDGLDIRITDAMRPWRNAQLRPTPSGTWMTPRLPGLDAVLAEKPADWSTHQRSFVVAVEDDLHRFLPVRFQADLPVRGRFAWPSWSGFATGPIAPLLPAGAPAGYAPDYLPLFPAIARTAPGPRATVRAQLAVRQADGTDLPAGWAAMTVSVSGTVIGLGIADVGGAIVVSGAYPTLPSQTVEEAAAGRSEVAWEAVIKVYYGKLAGSPPALDEILGQLSKPPTKALATLKPAEPELPAQTLVLGRPLTLATGKTATERFSSLYLKAN